MASRLTARSLATFLVAIIFGSLVKGMLPGLMIWSRI